MTVIIGANKTQAISNLTSTPVQKAPLIGFLTEGTINSLITTPTTKWMTSGNWSMNVNNGNVTLFETNMTWNNINGTNAHSHEFQNFRVSSPISVNQSDKNISIKGLMDVGTNQRVVWKDIPSSIDINGKKTISISVDDNKTNQHFASQPILGVVKSFLICSDIPGPNMEVLPPCSPSALPASISPPLASNESLTRVQSNLTSQPTSMSENASEPLQQAQSQSQLTTIPSPSLGNVSSPYNVSPNFNNISISNFSTYENKYVRIKSEVSFGLELEAG